jgi:hypothetical protein
VQVQGGYIELFGQIFNTNRNGGGKLRVLDGYGRSRWTIRPPSRVGEYPRYRPRGEGRVNITNIKSADPNNGR